MEKDRIIDNAKKLIESIHEYSESQAHLWQQIPWWANQANGRTGWSDNYNRTINSGYLAINTANNGYYTIFIDLVTGKLVSPFKPEKRARDKDVIQLAYNLDEINAEKMLKYLKEESQKNYRSYSDREKEEAELIRQKKY